MKIWFLPSNTTYSRGLGFCIFCEHLVTRERETHNKWNRHVQILWHQAYFWQPIIQLLGNSFKAIPHVLHGKVILFSYAREVQHGEKSRENKVVGRVPWFNTFKMTFIIWSCLEHVSIFMWKQRTAKTTGKESTAEIRIQSTRGGVPIQF